MRNTCWSRLRRTAWRTRWDAWRFAGRRADYFDYLQAVLRAQAGRVTIRELFERDARRYGMRSVRGRLSRTWARACEASGGDLYATWLGSFPDDELVLVRTAQAYGNTRLLDSFQALARHLALLDQTRRILWLTLGTAGVAMMAAMSLIAAVPWWTVPALEKAFHGLPYGYYGPWSRALVESAQWLQTWGFALPLTGMTCMAMLLFSLPRPCTGWRAVLDKVGPWKLYRQVQAMRLLSLLGILLSPGAGYAPQLRPLLLLLLSAANAWMRSHLGIMVRRLDQGHRGADAFDSGLLDRDVYWYLEDVVEAHGLSAGIKAVCGRLEAHWLARVRLGAQAFRWTLLLAAVAMVILISLWHYAAIDELRRGWMMFHAGY